MTIDTDTIERVNRALTDGDVVIDRGQVCRPPSDMAREPPHPDTLDVHCLRHVREHGPMRLAMLYRYLDIILDANHTEIGESLARLKREGLLTVQGDEVRAVTRSEQSNDGKDNSK